MSGIHSDVKTKDRSNTGVHRFPSYNVEKEKNSYEFLRQLSIQHE